MAGMFGDAINQRADFFDQLAKAQQELAALLQRLPYEAPLKSVGEQLASIERWTANGRTPTLKERKGITIGLQMFKEYDASDDDGIYDVRPKISYIDAYFKFWPDDKTAADPNNSDYLFFTDL
jgi:hypothetical protein